MSKTKKEFVDLYKKTPLHYRTLSCNQTIHHLLHIIVMEMLTPHELLMNTCWNPKWPLNISPAQVTGISKRALNYRCSINKILEKLKVNSENFYILPCSNDFSLIGTYTEFFDIIGILYNKKNLREDMLTHIKQQCVYYTKVSQSYLAQKKTQLLKLVCWCNWCEHTSRWTTSFCLQCIFKHSYNGWLSNRTMVNTWHSRYFTQFGCSLVRHTPSIPG